MTLESFAQLYEKDMKPKLKLNTWLTKESIIQKKILPYFGKRKLSEITAKDVMDWQNAIRGLTDAKGKPYSPTYLKTVHNQLSALFNHAVRYYGLQVNPAAKAGNMGVEERREMLFWTKDEYLKFADAMMDKPLSYYAFEMLYWCGIREGELLALTPTDFDFEAGTVSINKSYQRLKGKDVITTPKTKKSNRVIKMPKFLCGEMEDYLKMFYSTGANERIFPVSKHYLHHEMDRGAKAAGVKRIRIHDLRHSHISLLIDMGFTALAIADRVGHESIDITYRYAHLFPTRQTEMADKLDFERMGT
jgi:integrase